MIGTRIPYTYEQSLHLTREQYEALITMSRRK